MKSLSSCASVVAAALLMTLGAARAGEGHDHGEATPAASGPALPRFAAVSEAFELVGVLNGKLITLYLDRAADNSPVADAKIELEIAGAKFIADKHDGDAFEVVLAAAPKPGVLPITATVTVGQEVDLLAGELDLHEDAHGDAAAHIHSWQEFAAWGAGAVAALVALTLLGWRLLVSRRLRAGGAA